MTGHSLAMVAGEKSGDLLAAAVLAGLRASGYFGRDGVAAGIGGDAMVAQGFENWWHVERLSVRGYAEVLPALPRLLWTRRRLRQRVLKWQPALFMGVDAPDFNLDLEVALRSAGQKVLHFISPSIWAWRRERIEKIRRAVDHMLLVFPFEAEIYRAAGVPATYVGHPLADAIPLQVDRAAARAALDLPADARIVALLPGSRPDEIRYMADCLIDTAIRIGKRAPDVRFLLPAAGEGLFADLTERLTRRADSIGGRIALLRGRSHEALAAADTALIASGTATLEAMFFHRPMVIVYKMSPWSYRVMKNKGYQPYVGLPNILFKEFVVPEFLQEQAHPQALADAVLAQLDSPSYCALIAERFAAQHQAMRLDCAARASAVIGELAHGQVLPCSNGSG